ncbi:MAG: 1-acyl-sn-glycerol-3-phosphate acyltransferase [Cyanobacteria bacterium]|nr:1-acyl-sn-glycerol-3-phosphate acyltransferase [Cyanobacteriota bacterium]
MGEQPAPPKNRLTYAVISNLEAMVNGAERLFRRLGHRYMRKRLQPTIDKVSAILSNTTPEAPDYISKVMQVARLYANVQPIEAEVNTEDKRLEAIAASDEACIFVINHDHQAEDPVLLSMTAVLLYNAYAKLDKLALCPRPGVILNEDIIQTSPPEQQALWHKMGVIGVDASVFPSKKGVSKNTRAFMRVLPNFCQDKQHLFIFPEGRLSAFKGLALRQKFQTGVADIVRASLKRKERVKIVPLGFAYGKKTKQRLGSIYVGEPVIFTRQGENTLVSVGNITPKNASAPYQQFFWPGDDFNPFITLAGSNTPFKVMTHQRKPIKNTDLSPFIADVLAENLTICRDLAQTQLPAVSLKGSHPEKIGIY